MYLIFLKNIASLIVFQGCGILFFLAFHVLLCYTHYRYEARKISGCAAGVSPICNTPRSYRASRRFPA